MSGETLLGTPGHAWLLPQVVYGFRFPNKVNVCGITHPPVIKRGNSEIKRAIENPPFMDDIPIQTSIYRGFPIVTFDYQRVSCTFFPKILKQHGNKNEQHMWCTTHSVSIPRPSICPRSKHSRVVFRLMWVCQKIGHNIWWLFITVLRKQKPFGRVGGV